MLPKIVEAVGISLFIAVFVDHHGIPVLGGKCLSKDFNKIITSTIK
jgi:hypothetical protein